LKGGELKILGNFVVEPKNNGLIMEVESNEITVQFIKS